MTRFDLEGFVSDEDPRGQNALLQFAPLCYVIAQRHPRSATYIPFPCDSGRLWLLDSVLCAVL